VGTGVCESAHSTGGSGNVDSGSGNVDSGSGNVDIGWLKVCDCIPVDESR
jgi:hypothetical protein